MLIVIYLVVLVRTVTGLQCLYCEESILPTDCDTIITCGPHEECSLDVYVSGTGRIRYKMGCKDRNQCVTQQTIGKRKEIKTSREVYFDAVNTSVVEAVRHKQGSSDVIKRSADMLVCSDCCQSTLCNAAGCGTHGYPSQRGPICSNCQYQNSSDDCDKITVCGLDETCQLSRTQDPVLHLTRFHSGCENEMRCSIDLEKFRQIVALVVGKRSSSDTVQSGSSCIMKCCNSDLCNNNCEMTTQPLAQTTVTNGATVTSAIPTQTSTTEHCLSNPCKGGTCSEYHNTYRCTCSFGFWGINCENVFLASTVSQQQETTTIYPTTARPSNCYDIQRMGLGISDGIYTITLWRTDRTIAVLCDLTTDGGGWTVFQKRFDGSVDFYRNFNNYTSGFGNVAGEFWLGLDIIHEMTTQRLTELRIDVTAPNGTEGYELFKNFSISEGPGYVLHNLPGTGTLEQGFGLSYHNGQPFSTYDHDNDNDFSKNCASTFHGGWWYNSCYNVNLNGQYLAPGTVKNTSMNYYEFTKFSSLRSSRMMFRDQH